MRTPWVSGFIFSLLLTSCASIQEIEKLPADNYHIPAKSYLSIANSLLPPNKKKVPVNAEEINGVLYISPESAELSAIEIQKNAIEDLKLHRYTLDIDVFTVPFKVRPAVNSFPPQLSPNFSGAMYVGRRHDYFQIKAMPNRKQQPVKITGVGFGYGGLLGFGSVTMNPFVTQGQINYEYDGLVLSSGLAGIYDAKKFNIGVAIGTDFLQDKNRHHWLYQSKPWLGFIFGIDLN